ncbi:MAG: META domain-containing protein [Pseudomonadota bacterium]
MFRATLALLILSAPAMAQTSTQTSTQPLPLTARGNEPGWVLSLTDVGARASLEGGGVQDWGLPVATADGADTLYALEAGTILRLSPGVCRDSMTGMPYPLAVSITQDKDALTGCGGDPAALLAGDWRLTRLAGQDVPAGVQATLTVSDGMASGRSGCNRYGGTVTLTGEGLTFGPQAGTRMMCAALAMTVEAAYLDALPRVTRFDIADDGGLLLLAGDDALARLAR